MAVDDGILAAIEAVYDAALDDALWPAALERLAVATDSQAATFWVLDRSERPRLPVFSAVNFDPAFIQEYLDRMTPMDPTVRYLVAHPDQSIVHDGEYLTERDIDLDPYYDWHLRYTDARYRMLGQIRPAPALQAGVTLHRTRLAGRYQRGDIDRFAVLYRHIERALAIGFRLGSTGALQQTVLELLERNPLAMVLLDQRRRVIHANGAADAVLAAGDGIALSASGPLLASPADQHRLDRLIAQALDGTGVPSVGGMMRVARPSGRRPYLLLVSPVSRRMAALPSGQPAVCVAISDPGMEHAGAVELLQDAFGLTPAEARLAALLAAGDELKAAAARLGIGYGTARTRLAEIFQKTQTHRQPELVGQLLAALMLC